MYEELVQELRRLADEQFFDFEKSPYIKAADAIEELQAQINGWIEMERKALIKSVLKWINVKERLPEKSGLYLTYNPRRSFMTMHYSAKNKAWNAFDHEDEPKYVLEVTHWLPLPEPPKEDDNA